ncbi:Dda-like helicase [Dinoroseobacter phage vB_DshS-R5C]|uniref:Exodeoxyribonuclease-5 n=1 Tax=Dinoroseobacter phage vB_DshS-R5C TaxID=1965368 RepID=A0A1V0DYB3_9CAUD|nr:Dda-like helicase [Dinoroseobacter phage vB_DshS-R5C]ARB06143.1 exodeoxyribonuclease-5 [Dinoroseobacter phage vB_DshS-R5C]
MDWSDDQKTALTRIDQWLKQSDSPRFSLGGYAGTGKTTLAKHIAESHGGDVRFAAFTGKAASVLRAKGCPGATTIHKLIYQPKGDTNASQIDELRQLIENESAKPEPDRANIATWKHDLERLEAESNAMFERKAEAEIAEADLVIIDESSMVDRRMGSDLESYGVPILYLGDPGQLPPVKGKAHLRPGEYDYVLEQIHRQAADSPIIWLANQVRNGHEIQFGTFDGLVRCLPKSSWDMDLVVNADQVLTGTNVSRHRITRSMRKHIGFEQLYPLANDKLVIRKNDHEKAILNGVTCRAVREGFLRNGILRLDIEYDGRVLADQLCCPGYFQENYGERTVWKKGDGITHVDYGYCITGHKSQGSQWRHVVVADDRMRAQDREQRKRWLYTVITRAEEELTYYV